MQFIQEHPISNIDEIKNILDTIDNPFEPSQVYNAQTDTKLVKPELRFSEFRTLTNAKLFDEAQKLVQQINSKQNGKKFILYYWLRTGSK